MTESDPGVRITIQGDVDVKAALKYAAKVIGEHDRQGQQCAKSTGDHSDQSK